MRNLILTAMLAWPSLFGMAAQPTTPPARNTSS